MKYYLSTQPYASHKEITRYVSEQWDDYDKFDDIYDSLSISRNKPLLSEIAQRLMEQEDD